MFHINPLNITNPVIKDKKTFIIKDGNFSIILSNGYYEEFIGSKNFNINPILLDGNDNLIYNDELKFGNKLIRITYDNERHNQKMENIIREIDVLKNYTSVPEKKKYKIAKNTMLYAFISTLKFPNHIHTIILNNYDLYYQYINYEGECDLQNIFQKIYDNNNLSIWDKNITKKMHSFIIHILEGIKYLHINKIVHLDIKPENILYNELLTNVNFGRRFKLIDFGFASQEPFSYCLHNLSGTPGYTPIYYNRNEDCLPNSNPNDWNYQRHISLDHPNDKRYEIYKTDIYCFGRTIYYLDYLINEKLTNKYYNKKICCFMFKKNKYTNIEIQRLISCMTDEDIKNRYNIDFCLRYVNSYFY